MNMITDLMDTDEITCWMFKLVIFSVVLITCDGKFNCFLHNITFNGWDNQPYWSLLLIFMSFNLNKAFLYSEPLCVSAWMAVLCFWLLLCLFWNASWVSLDGSFLQNIVCIISPVVDFKNCPTTTLKWISGWKLMWMDRCIVLSKRLHLNIIKNNGHTNKCIKLFKKYTFPVGNQINCVILLSLSSVKVLTFQSNSMALYYCIPFICIFNK